MSIIKRSPLPNEKKEHNNFFLISSVVFLFIVGLSIATQHYAYTFQYQDLLGSHLYHFYAPWAILIWYIKWFKHYSDQFIESFMVGMLFPAVGMLILIAAQMARGACAKGNIHLHGSASWATLEDIKEAGLLNCEGVYIGSFQNNYLRHHGAEHVLLLAPTRSGKGVGLIIPTLLSWPHSVLISDLKGELWALTAGWRKNFAQNKTLKFEPAAVVGSICWNPLLEIRIGTEYEVGDVQNLALLLVDPDGKGLENHWQKTAHALFVGLILHALYKNGEDASLASIDSMLSDPKKGVGELWKEMLKHKHYEGKNHPVIAAAARDMLDRPEEEAGSILSTAKSYLSLYRDPVIAKNTSKSDFYIKDLMYYEDPVSLYIVTQPNDKTRLKPLVRILVNMSMRLLADKMEFEKGRPKVHYKHRLLVMLDEFPSLGKLDIMQESLAFVAGYGIKCFLVCQDINQLKSREAGYGHDETITSNCHIQIAYPPNRLETAEYLSRLIGDSTVEEEQISISGRLFGFASNISKTFMKVKRRKLTEEECLRMQGPKKDQYGNIIEGGAMLIHVAGCKGTIYGKQPLYFQDPVFQARAEIPAPKISDILRKVDEKIKL